MISKQVTSRLNISRFHSGTTVVSSLHASETDTLEHSTSLQTLAKRLALVNANTTTQTTSNVNNNVKLTFAIAGGGSRAISALASTPGASSILGSGNVLYDRKSFGQYVTQYLPSDYATMNSPNTAITSLNRDGRFGFASSGAAVLLSRAALNHALHMTNSLKGMEDVIGVGCTSTLVSHGREDRKSRIHIAISKGNTPVSVLYNIILGNGGNVEYEVHDDQLNTPVSVRRDRNEEEELVAKLILSSILQELREDCPSNEDILSLDAGDSIEMIEIGNALSQPSATTVVGKIIDQNESSVDAAILTRSSLDGKMKPLSQVKIPSDPIIFPGSFNPPHIGHISLAQAAVKVMTEKKCNEIDEYFKMKQSGTSDNVLGSLWNTVAYEDLKLIDLNVESPFTVLFEMSLTNADKPAMEVSEAMKRISLFETLESNISETSESLPSDWGVLLTSAPLFIDKVNCLKKYLSSPYANSTGDHIRKMTFVIGTDTMVRLINPKYYGNSCDAMLASLKEMRDEGVHFVVGGRVSQIKDGADDSGDAPFVTGEEELESLPRDVQNMFTLMPEFRIDISSTELRKKLIN